jgi:hypothetical protein
MRDGAAVEAVCTDMHRPYLNAVGEVLGHAAIVFGRPPSTPVRA